MRCRPLAAIALLAAAAACQSSPHVAKSAGPVDAGVDARPVPGPTIQLRLSAPGWDAETVERRAVTPAETALRGAPGLVDIAAAATAGGGLVVARFASGTPAPAALRTVDDRARPALPGDVTPHTAVSSAGARLRYVVRSATMPLADQRELAERAIVPRLARAPGVADARACGGALRQASVTVDPARLAGAGLSARDVTAALARPAGYAAADEIGAAVIATRNGSPVRIADVGQVAIGPGPPDCWVVGADGGLGVEVSAIATDDVAPAIDAARAELPAHVELERLPDAPLRLVVALPPGARMIAAATTLAGAVRDLAPGAWVRGGGDLAPEELEIDLPPVTNPDAVAAAVARLPDFGPVRTPDDEIEVPIAGAELDPLAGAARELRKALATTTGVGAVGVAGAGVEPRAFVDIDAQALTRAGVHAADVDELVRIARGGVAVARLNDGPRDVPVVVRLPDDGGRPASLGRLVVGSPGGAVPLASVAAITMRLAATGIVHRDGERAVVVWVRPRAGANRAALRLSVWVAAESVKLPPGVRLVRPRQ